MMKINVIGLGYIGLPTALCIAVSGFPVVGIDKKKEVLDTLMEGKLTFKEAGLEELFTQARESGNLSFAARCTAADIYIVAVPTPYIRITKEIETTYIVGAVKDILAVAPEGAVIAIESTVSPGTIAKYIVPLTEAAGRVCGNDIYLAHVPERIIPGNMLYELKHNSRTLGVAEPETADKLMQLYRSFCKGEMVVTDIETAEMAKVVENTYRDINIAFANELAKMCSRANLDVYEIIRVANRHPRVNILAPGPGVGGHCISVDPWFLVGDYPDIVNIIRQARVINDGMPEYVLERISNIMKKEGIKDISEVGFYGLTYKEDVDDIRESPTLQLIQCMERHLSFGAKFYDPVITKAIVDNQYTDFMQFLGDIRLLVIMVGHQHIQDNINKIAHHIIYDTRNCIPLNHIHKL